MARRRRRTVYINDKRWKIQWDAPLRGDFYGTCDYGSRTIQLRKGQNVADLVDTIIHEIVHARWPDLDEHAVVDISETISGFLDASGLLAADQDAEE